jgi:hypothetical protein
MYSLPMKYLVLASALTLLAPCVHAYGGLNKDDDDDAQKEQSQKAPEEIPDFSNLNEYVYQPKTTLNLGFRSLSGVKAKFAGNGFIPIPAADAEIDPTLVNVARVYQDGAVGPDGRSLAINNGDGTNTAILASPDGKTNTYGYASATQVTPDDLMTFHDYSAAIPGVSVNQAGKRNDGVEISASRDMGKIGKHLSWSIFGGVSINDIQAATFQSVKATITTTTDVYDLFGQSPIPAGTSSPSNTTVSVNGSNGNQIIGPDGSGVTQSVSNSGLIGNVPLARTVTTSTDMTSVVDHFKLHGAYFTFRLGPSLVYSFNDHLKFSVSAGPAIIYAGSTYDVSQALTPPTGDPVVVDIFDRTQKLVPAYYVDATVQYDVTDRTGFYLGGVYQNGGSYLQTAGSLLDGTYTTRVDFSDQNGLRTGLTFKF